MLNNHDYYGDGAMAHGVHLQKQKRNYERVHGQKDGQFEFVFFNISKEYKLETKGVNYADFPPGRQEPGDSDDYPLWAYRYPGIEAFRARQEDPDIKPGMPTLVDCHEVEPADSREVVQYVAANIHGHAARLKCGPVAIFVSTDIEYGMARMYIALSEMSINEPNLKTEIFRDREEALAWLRKEPN